MKVYIYTFGCKVNSFESSAMAGVLTRGGFEICSDDAAADVVIVNSCTVTANGDRKVNQYMRRIKRNNPNTIIVLSGCMPQAYPEKAAGIEDVDIVTGTGNRLDIAQLINDFVRQRQKTVSIRSNAEKVFELLGTDYMQGHTRAFLKIEDGCERYCAYCIVPFARGSVRSMPLDIVKNQVEGYTENGYREIVLSGINLSFYGSDLGLTLADAVKCAASAEGVTRIRLGSLEPDLLPDNMLIRLSKTKKLCPHFHLALQSGCDDTLRRMSRRYDTSQFSAVANRIRTLFDNPTFTTDVMVGFPGETEQEFKQSLAFVESFGFLKVHVFPYSVRPGTAAAGFSGQLDKAAKERRAALMAKAANVSRKRVLESFIGTTEKIILEQPHAGGFEGYTDRYLPAVVTGGGLANGMVVSGTISGVENGRCMIRAVEEDSER